MRKWTDHYKRYFEPPGNKVGYDFQNSSYIKDLLVLNEEKEKKIYFVPTRRLNFLQTSYFVYDRSSLIKPTFITGINNFLLIYCLVSNFLEKKIRQIKNNISCQTKTFSNWKTLEKGELNLEIVKVSRKKNRNVRKKGA